MIMYQLSNGTASFTPYILKARTRLSCIINNVAAADLATQGAKVHVSVAMALTPLFWNIPYAAP